MRGVESGVQKGGDEQTVTGGYLEEEVDYWRPEVEGAQLEDLEEVLEARVVVAESLSLLLDDPWEVAGGRMPLLQAVCLMVLPMR